MPPLSMLVFVGSTTVAAMFFMTVLALSVICRSAERRMSSSRVTAIAVPVLEVTGTVPESVNSAEGIVHIGAETNAHVEHDERAPILVQAVRVATAQQSVNSGFGSGAIMVGRAGIAESGMVIGRRA